MTRMLEIFEEDIRLKIYITIPLKHKIYKPPNAVIDKSYLNSYETKNTIKVVPMDTLLYQTTLLFLKTLNHKKYSIQLFTCPRSFIICVSHSGLLKIIGPPVKWVN